LPIFREIMVRVYKEGLAGAVPQFPSAMEGRIDAYLAASATPAAAPLIAYLGHGASERASDRADGSQRNNRLVASPHDAYSENRSTQGPNGGATKAGAQTRAE
jgi:hypothetical protein